MIFRAFPIITFIIPAVFLHFAAYLPYCWHSCLFRHPWNNP